MLHLINTDINDHFTDSWVPFFYCLVDLSWNRTYYCLFGYSYFFMNSYSNWYSILVNQIAMKCFVCLLICPFSLKSNNHWDIGLFCLATWSFCASPHMRWMILSEDSCHSYFLSNVIWYIQFSPSVFVTKALHSANVIQPNKNVLVTI